MAVVFDALSSGAVDANTITVAHTCTGSNRLLVVGIGIDGAQTVSAGYPTYAGVEMTQVATFAPGNFRIYIYYLVAPATGANNIVCNFSAAQDIGLVAVSYTGVAQTTPLDANTAGADDASEPIGGAITTVADNDLVLFVAVDAENAIYVRTVGIGDTGSTERDVLCGYCRCRSGSGGNY